jgi:hypothetical protein
MKLLRPRFTVRRLMAAVVVDGGSEASRHFKQ